ncbi:Gp49 family protein [Paraburkholderia sediminicola]|uniref:Gp49 family protein n=1 Tax=Paraburkholderia sediminicola TaxID=458836 RepID=UPI0038BC1624
MTQHYIGSKQIVAWPEERDGKSGYAVKYPDGYTSWSPKETFEAAYLPQGHDGSRVNEQMVCDFIASHESTRLGNHTVVLVKLRNGFTLIEESACVDPANYDQAIGEQYALMKAKSRVWNLLGFLLATARNGIGVE